jgi:uncharacterized protein YciI
MRNQLVQFLLTAYDGTDDQALARRMSVRETHIHRNDVLRDEGKLLYAAAILDDADKMIGSVMIYDLDSREELDALLANEPYVTGDVWRKIDIEKCRVGPTFAHKVPSSSK